jgi:hypothetical protein
MVGSGRLRAVGRPQRWIFYRPALRRRSIRSNIAESSQSPMQRLTNGIDEKRQISFPAGLGKYMQRQAMA